MKPACTCVGDYQKLLMKLLARLQELHQSGVNAGTAAACGIREDTERAYVASDRLASEIVNLAFRDVIKLTVIGVECPHKADHDAQVEALFNPVTLN